MFTHRYHLLEREFNETTLRLASPLDVEDRNRMMQRLKAIILEARGIVTALGYPAPRWCATTK
jgi:hypothetical protein